ncbi:ATP-binding protein [Streptomyces sp. NPDC051364]|uniref:ATP-binding protein n=1 Tax=Streptomyces sp. NPDC051364 TaxID=3155799 RepID=UPI003440E678
MLIETPEAPMTATSSTGEPRYSDGYTANHAAPARARRDAALYLRTWGLDALVDDAQLIVSELVTNAVLQAADRSRDKGTGRVGMSATRTETGVRLVVTDTDRTPPRLRPMKGGRGQWEGGPGLGLVADLAARWGCDRLSSGKRLWAELDIAEEPTAR